MRCWPVRDGAAPLSFCGLRWLTGGAVRAGYQNDGMCVHSARPFCRSTLLISLSAVQGLSERILRHEEQRCAAAAGAANALLLTHGARCSVQARGAAARWGAVQGGGAHVVAPAGAAQL